MIKDIKEYKRNINVMIESTYAVTPSKADMLREYKLKTSQSNTGFSKSTNSSKLSSR